MRNAETMAEADPLAVFGALELADKRGDYRAALRYQRQLEEAGWEVRRCAASRRGSTRPHDAEGMR